MVALAWHHPRGNIGLSVTNPAFFNSWQDARVYQRRLASARTAANNEESVLRFRYSVENLANLIVAAKKHPRILACKMHQARVRRSILILANIPDNFCRSTRRFDRRGRGSLC